MLDCHFLYEQTWILLQIIRQCVHAIAGGKKIGVLKSASSGVVQVMAQNSVEVSDYGMYDTSKIEKEIMVTVKASFEIK